MTNKRAYSFKEGLTMMAAKEVGIDPYLAADAGEDARGILAALRRATTAKGPEKSKHIAAAQTELRKLNPKQHGKLINALQAKVLALQGRGGDTAVAHLEPGEIVVPRRVLTPELAQLIASEAAKRGINPKQLIVGSRKASINPATGAEEFGVWDTVKGWFADSEDEGIRKSFGITEPPKIDYLEDINDQDAFEAFIAATTAGERNKVHAQFRHENLDNPAATLAATFKWVDGKKIAVLPQLTLHDAALLQDIHPDDFVNAPLAPQHMQDLWKKTGYIDSDRPDFVDQNGDLRTKTFETRPHYRAGGGLLRHMEAQTNQDAVEAGHQKLKLPAEALNPVNSSKLQEDLQKPIEKLRRITGFKYPSF
jgi:hypothetical protein